MDVQLPDGTMVKGVPDGTSKLDLATKLKANGMNVPDSWLAPAPDKAAGSDVPGYTPVAKQPDAKPSSWLDKLVGVGEAGLSAASSIPAQAIGGAAGIAKGLTGGKLGTQAGVDEAADTSERVSRKLTYTPRTTEGKADLAKAGDFIDKAGLAGLPVDAGMAGAVGEDARAAAPVVRNTADLANTRSAAALGEAGQAAKGAAAKALPDMSIKPETLALAKKAQAMGIPLRPDMLYDNKLMRMVGEFSEKLPLSGSGVEARQTAFNRQAIKAIGGDAKAKSLTPDVFANAMDTSGKKIGDVIGRTEVPLDDKFLDELAEHSDDAKKFQTEDVAKVVNSYVDELVNKGEHGEIGGKALRTFNTKLGTQIRNTPNGDLRHALSDLQDTLHDKIEENMSEADSAEWHTARRQYANGKTLEPLVAKSKTGDISPAGLMGATTNTRSKKAAMARGRGGDLGDMARVGQQFMKEQPSSGTAERTALIGGSGAVGAALAGHPAVLTGAAATTALANLYNRYGPAIARSKVARELKKQQP
jgi:hypothetical protein